MTVSLKIKNKKFVSFDDMSSKVADIFYIFAKKGNTSKGDYSIKCKNTYSTTLNGEYVDIDTFYKQNDITPFSDKKFKHFEKTNVTVTIYDELNCFSGYEEPHNYPVIEMDVDFITKKKDSLEMCLGNYFFDYYRYSTSIDFNYDSKWFDKIKIKNKIINHLLLFVVSKSKEVEKQLDADKEKITEALKEVA
tara:strand:+ start:184 stop:759 length:576 start_codon:yes stop_codon:yes gene_type:complete